MTTAVLFDFYGTLAHAVTWGPRKEDVLGRYGYTVPEDANRAFVDSAIDGLDHREHSVSAEAYSAWERSRWSRLVEACGVGPDDAERLVDELHSSGKSFVLEAYPDAVPVLRSLRAQGVVVAVCSNWDWHLDRALDQTGLASEVDVVVASARAGVRKPHPLIYEATLEACDAEACDVIFVGDSVGPDVEGPLAMGMQPVHVWRDDRDEPPPPLPAGVPRVDDVWPVTEMTAKGSRASWPKQHNKK